MAHYKVQTDKGLVEFDAERPDLSKQEVEQVINQNTGASPKETPLMQSVMGKMMGPARAQKAYDALSVPMQKSQQGLEMMAQGLTPTPEVTGNPTMDVIRNYPAISARTLSKVAPGFISPESIASAAIAPVVGLAGKGVRAVARPVGRWAGTQLEELSGMVPGALKEAFNDATAIVAKGKKAAQPLYEAGKDYMAGGPEVNPSAVFDEKGILQATPKDKIRELSDTIKTSLEHKEVVQAADQLADMGQLDPAQALKARKSIDRMIRNKSAPLDTLFDMRGKIDKIVKSDPNFGQADLIHQKGMMAESLRSFLPKTANGKPSSWKTMMAGMSGIPAMFSPIALGTGSTLAGLVGRNVISPLINAPVRPAMTAAALLKAKRDGK